MTALLLAKALVPAGAELPLLPAAVTCTVLAVTALFWLGVFPGGFLLGRRPAEHEPLPQGGTAGSASRSPFLHFVVLCFGMGAVLHAEPLAAAAEHHLHQAAVVCGVLAFAVLINCAILCLNFGLAVVGSSNPAHSALSALAALMRLKSPYSASPPSAERKDSRPAATPPPLIAEAQPPIGAPALRPYQSRLARAALVILSALISTSWFLEPVAAAAAGLRLPRPAVVAILVVFATCFFTSVHVFRSFFLPRPPAAAAQQWEGIAVIAAVGAGVAACLVAAGGSVYGCAPARS
ncbi:hypothetical protein BS78_02G195900 [Paspalum vaginatum]|nr:hypothetical protein BS78_02G195900 [Paspalum vaginatum]